MTYKVSVSSGNNYSVKLSQKSNYKISLSNFVEIIMPINLNELADVQISGNNDKYVLMYDAASGKWKDVNPDEVLNAAAETESTQPGLVGFATSFIDTMEQSTDVDAGTF